MSDTLAAILRGDPDWKALPADVPLPIRTVIAGCLTKDRRQRVADLSAALFVFDHRAHLASAAGSSPRVARVPLWRRAAVAATVIFVALAAGYAGWRLRPAPSRPVMRLAITMPEHEVFTPGPSAPLAISRDGTRMAYTASALCCAPSISSTRPPSSAWKVPGSQARESRSFRLTVSGSVSGRPGCSRRCRSAAARRSRYARSRRRRTRAGRPITRSSSAMVHAASFVYPATADRSSESSPSKTGSARAWPSASAGRSKVLFTLARTASWDEAEIVVQSLERRAPDHHHGGTDGQYLPTGHLVCGCATP